MPCPPAPALYTSAIAGKENSSWQVHELGIMAQHGVMWHGMSDVA